MKKISEVRLTLYAFIYSIEKDLRVIIRNFIIPQFNNSNFLNLKLKNKVSNRFLSQHYGLDPEENLDDLIEFLDFRDNYQVILSNNQVIPDSIILKVKKLVPTLNEIAPIRNRVMHSRPLLKGDFNIVLRFIKNLNSSSELPWKYCIQTIKRMRDDPSFILDLKIPDYWRTEEVKEHNLPFPDFDETGFIGREKDIEEIERLILTNPHNGVISIIGEGGIGKTAIALKTAYDIIDLSDKCPYDIVIWVSAKTTILTKNGIENLKDTIHNFKGIIDHISKQFSPLVSDTKDSIKEILLFMDYYKVFLIIDNLETILNNDIREFVRQAQTKSKILITSRIGLGELEYPRKITGFSEIEATIFIREFAIVRNTILLQKMSNKQINFFAKKLYYNPLALKWFAKSVDLGKTPDELINHKQDLFDFCLSNVYEKLNNNAVKILNTLLASRINLSSSMLIFLSELDNISLRKAINILLASSFLRRQYSNEEKSNSEIEFYIPEFVRDYLVHNYPPQKKFVKYINKKLHDLQSKYEDTQREKVIDKYRVQSIDIKNTNQKIVANILINALKYSREKNFKLALDKIKEAKDFLPEYVEIYRISAFIKASNGDLIGAEDDYKMGLELDSENAVLLYFYGGFLLMEFDDVSKALIILSKLIKIDNSADPSILFSRCLTYNNEYKKSIDTLKKLLKQNNKLTSKHKKLIFTLLIEAFQRWGDEKYRIEKDFNKAILYYKESLKHFELSVSNNEIDFTMIKKFVNTFLRFVNNIPKLNFQNGSEYFETLFINNFIYIKQSNYFGSIIYKLKKNYNVNINRSFLSEVFKTKEDINNIERYDKGTIVKLMIKDNKMLIKNDLGEIYTCNKTSLKNPSLWFSIFITQTVYFNVGSNSRGLFANNIIPIV